MTRKIYLDVLKLIATLGVIHAHSTFHFDLTTSNFDRIMLCARDSTLWWIIPLFLMISGATVLEKEWSIKLIFQERISRFLRALVIWWLLYYVWSVFEGLLVSRQFIFNIYENPGVHLWYLLLISVVYMLLPLLRRLIICEVHEKIFLTVWAGIIFIVFFMISELPNGIKGLYCLFSYCGYLILGHYLSQKKYSSSAIILLVLGGLFGFVFSWLGTLIHSRYNFAQNIGPCQTLMAMVIFVFFKEKEKFLLKHISGFVDYVRRESFGVYLIHMAWLRLLVLIPLHFKLHWFISSVLLTIVVYWFSLFSIKILRSIPFIRTIVI